MVIFPLLTVLLSAWLAVYFALYRPVRPATLGLVVLCAARALEQALVVAHSWTDHAPVMASWLWASQGVVMGAVAFVTLVVVRHELCVNDVDGD